MIADFATLAKLAATRKPKGVQAWLAWNRVKYFLDTKGRPATTLAALDRALNRGVEVSRYSTRAVNHIRWSAESEGEGR